MFCINCGKEVKDEDAFCGYCGQPTNGGNEGIDSNLSGNLNNNNVNGSMNTTVNNFNKVVSENTFKIGKILKIYFKNPLKFFEEFKGQDLLKESVIMLIVLAIFNGIINLIERSAIISSIMRSVNNMANVFTAGTSSYNARGDVNGMQTVLNTIIDRGQIFLFGILYAAIFIGATTLIILILNATIFKNKMLIKDIFFISTMSYIPVVLGMVVGAIITYLSFGLGIVFIVVGYLAGAITLFNGIKKYSEENENKVFVIMLIYFAVILIISFFVVQYQTKETVLNVIQNIGKSKNSAFSIINGLF